MQPQSRLVRVARPLSWVTFASLVLLPLSLVLPVLRPEKWQAETLAAYPDTMVPAQIGAGLWAGIAVVDLVGLALTMVVLWHVHKLVRLYLHAQVLTDQNAHHILRAGQGLVVLAAFGVLAQTLDVLLLTWGNPVGQRALAISFTDMEVGLIVAGGVMVLIGWAMDQAARIADDHARII